jgi:methionyl-tRNA synthetase
LPATADAIADQLGTAPTTSWEVSEFAPGTELKQPKPIFPRIDLTKMQTQNPEPEPPKQEAVKPVAPAAPATPEQISIEDFMKVQLKVGRVLEAEPIEGATKLLKLQVMLGSEKRQIVAGIAANYAPIDLIGRQVIVVANLKPAKLRGVESQGMLLAAVDENNGAILLQPEKEAPDGGLVR